MVIDIPGRGQMDIRNIVFDFNGTVAVDGNVSDDVMLAIENLIGRFNVFVVTADTFGTVKSAFEGLGVDVLVIQKGNEAAEKKAFVEKIGAEHTMCIGNGANDVMMLEAAAFSVAVAGREGCASKLVMASDVLVCDILDAVRLICNPSRIIATLRE
jgi:soluble P-type ATPase